VVDRELLQRKAAQLEQYLAELATWRGLTLEGYLADWKTQRAIERCLHLAIETCVDLAEHVVADRHLRVPSSYAETFEILRDAGLVPAALAERLVRMARFRNLLVHDYARIDPARLLEVVRDHPSDLEAFKQIVLEVA
jgi:uncharacterized protein YutE (UPF0331/DUF86 family)